MQLVQNPIKDPRIRIMGPFFDGKYHLIEVREGNPPRHKLASHPPPRLGIGLGLGFEWKRGRERDENGEEEGDERKRRRKKSHHLLAACHASGAPPLRMQTLLPCTTPFPLFRFFPGWLLLALKDFIMVTHAFNFLVIGHTDDTKCGSHLHAGRKVPSVMDEWTNNIPKKIHLPFSHTCTARVVLLYFAYALWTPVGSALTSIKHRGGLVGYPNMRKKY
ncbi:hypothetical protein BHE74_00054550 [Ensete ventricosum]|nr:hypothetical protein BHE74_00054550 [Ensete ventricosum]